MAIMISVHTDNHVHAQGYSKRDFSFQEVTTTTLKLYNFWANKKKLKIKGVKKISISFERQPNIQKINAPIPMVGAVSIIEVSFDFDAFWSIKNDGLKQIFFLDALNDIIANAAKELNWPLDKLSESYAMTKENILNNTIPEKFDPDSIWI